MRIKKPQLGSTRAEIESLEGMLEHFEEEVNELRNMVDKCMRRGDQLVMILTLILRIKKPLIKAEDIVDVIDKFITGEGYEVEEKKVEVQQRSTIGKQT